MKKHRVILIMLVLCQAGYSQNMDKLFNEFPGKENVNRISIGKAMMKLSSMFTETMDLQDAYYKLWSRRDELEIQEKLQQISRLINDLPDKKRQVLRLRSMPWPIAMPASATI